MEESDHVQTYGGIHMVTSLCGVPIAIVALNTMQQQQGFYMTHGFPSFPDPVLWKQPFPPPLGHRGFP